MSKTTPLIHRLQLRHPRITSLLTGRRLVSASNIGEGTHGTGNVTFRASAPIPRLCVVKLVAEGTVAPCDAAAQPLGVATDEAPAVGDAINVALFGATKGTLLGVAGAAVAAGAQLASNATGALVAAGAGKYVLGRALAQPAAINEPVEFIPAFPVQLPSA
jgi:hypothetical protein